MLPVPPRMQVVTLNSVHSSSPAEDSATTWALPPTLDATNITNTSVLLTASFPDLATPILQVVLQQVRVCVVLYVIMEVGREGDIISSTRPLHLLLLCSGKRYGLVRLNRFCVLWPNVSRPIRLQEQVVVVNKPFSLESLG